MFATSKAKEFLTDFRAAYSDSSSLGFVKRLEASHFLFVGFSTEGLNASLAAFMCFSGMPLTIHLARRPDIGLVSRMFEEMESLKELEESESELELELESELDLRERLDLLDLAMLASRERKKI